MPQGSQDVYTAALKRELAGYIASGDTERADAVRAELARVGGPAPETTATAPAESAVRPKPARRAR
jgi:hypothetical protein